MPNKKKAAAPKKMAFSRETKAHLTNVLKAHNKLELELKKIRKLLSEIPYWQIPYKDR